MPVKAKVKSLPDKPGIYFFKNEDREVIYIGKAHSLNKRVRSYFSSTSDPKIKKIIAETKELDFILTGSEREASFLENNFIRQHQPKFNIRLKDDKSFPYLKLSVQESFPRILLTRRVEKDGARYFGPFSPAHQARKTIRIITRYFKLRTCEEKIPGKRSRPCLDYDLGLCSAPCVSIITGKEYRENVEDALLFLGGHTSDLLESFKKKMLSASENKEYEAAAHYRDLISSVEQVSEKPKLISVKPEDKDIFGFFRKGSTVAVYVFLMRRGKVIESESLTVNTDAEKNDSEVLAEQVHFFYNRQEDIPDMIYLPFAPEKQSGLKKFLSVQKHGAVKLLIPAKGNNRRLVELAVRNAEALIEKPSAERTAETEIQSLLNMPKPLWHIEGFDISNTGGDESVGSLVVFKDGFPSKSDYRKFKVKSVTGPNDVASIKEVITRRYKRILEEKRPLPDLILVDGGKGQLHAAESALLEAGLEGIPIVSLAKKDEILFIQGQKDGIKLDRTSKALKLFQRIRDEAHRFAVSYHRKRRSKKSFE